MGEISDFVNQPYLKFNNLIFNTIYFKSKDCTPNFYSLLLLQNKFEMQFSTKSFDLEYVKCFANDLTQEYCYVSILDSCGMAENFEYLAAFGNKYSAINPLQSNQYKGNWVFGHIAYDYKNSIEPQLNSNNPRFDSFLDTQFFIPQILFYIQNNELFFEGTEDVWNSFLNHLEIDSMNFKNDNIKCTTGQISLNNYKQNFKELHHHIKIGNIYEVNFCIPFSYNNICLDPISIWQKMVNDSPAPFSVFYKNDDQFLICNSPERFIKKTNQTIICQPIKGTITRDKNPSIDEANKIELKNNSKERSENIMIVDLVRNDLSKIARPGSVVVTELCEIYSFKKVHQMISTVTASLNDSTDFKNIIHALFPMGSMTGAPKIRAMQLIEEQETFCRGIFSGSVGFIQPNGNFDFNVVIRSIIYNQQTHQAIIPAGSAITFKSNAEDEYNECLLKARQNNTLVAEYIA